MNKDLSTLSIEDLESYLEHCETMALQNRIKQESQKVLNNGLYGATGSKFFRYFNVDSAEAVTLSGQATIDAAQVFFNKLTDQITGVEKDRIFTVDTDSCFLDMTDVIDKVKPHMKEGGTINEIVGFLDRLGSTKYQDAMDQGFDDLQEKQNVFKKYLTMKREKIGSVITVAKKRYIAKVYVNEDVWYEDPDISITGLESARSDVPKFCRDKLEDTYEKMFDMTEEQIQAHIKAIEEEFMKLPVTQISVPKGLTDLDKYTLPGNLYRKGTTQHAKAAIIYNRLLVERGLTDRYTMIRSGDKLRVLELKIPNPLREEVIGFLDDLPKEFEIDKYVDRKHLFEKSFKKPISRVLEVMGWTADRKYGLDSFFD